MSSEYTVNSQVPGGGTAITPSRTVMDDVIDSIMTPGAGPGLVATINGALLLLVGILVFMIVKGTADIHTGVMLFLAMGLLASVNFFVIQLHAAEEASETDSSADAQGSSTVHESAAGVGLAATTDKSDAPEDASPSSASKAARRRRRD